MSSKNPFHKVGFVQDAHGIRGDLYIRIPSKELSWLSDVKDFELQVRDGSKPPEKFTLHKAKPHKDGIILKANEVPDRNRAEELKGYSFSIPVELLTIGKQDEFFLREVLDFEVFNQGQSVGTVVGFMDNGAQDLLQVKTPEGKEYLVPLVEAFLEGIDFEGKTIKMNLPEGLLEDL